MDYSVIDRVLGDSLEPGDFVLLDEEVWELLAFSDESVLEYHIYNHTTGDDDYLAFDPDSYYDLVSN